MTSVNTDYGLYESLGLTRPTETKKASDQLAQEDFLELMITELTNQDPTNPMDNADVAAQFANFSMVTGVAELSDSFTQLSGSLLQSQSLQAANLVGRNVLAESNQGQLSADGSLTGKLRLDDDSGNVQVRIYGTRGQLMRTLDLGAQTAGDVSFSWDGVTDQGAQAPAGSYRIQAQAINGEQTSTPKVLLSAPVESVELDGEGGILINIQGGGQVTLAQISAIA